MSTDLNSEWLHHLTKLLKLVFHDTFNVMEYIKDDDICTIARIRTLE